MACTTRYAEGWQFSAFWCASSILKNEDTSGLLAQPTLTCSQVNFLTFGVKANEGMICWNLTTGLDGFVTAVTQNSLTVTGVVWNDGDLFRVCTQTAEERTMAEHYLDITAGDLHAALAAANACSCTFAAWADNYLAKLNIIDAAIFYTCPCARPDISDEMRQSYIEFMNTQLELIRTGKLELCSGETGSDFPALDWAEQSLTEQNAALIIYNDR